MANTLSIFRACHFGRCKGGSKSGDRDIDIDFEADVDIWMCILAVQRGCSKSAQVL